MRVSLKEAKANLSELLRQAQAGEEVVIMRDDAPVARLVAIEPARPTRRPGRWQGSAVLDGGFFDPLPDTELAGWSA